MKNIHSHDLNPDMLLNAVKEMLGLKNDAALSRALQVNASTISKIRNGNAPVTPALLISMHEETDCSIRELRFLMGDYRLDSRPSSPLRAPQGTAQ